MPTLQQLKKWAYDAAVNNGVDPAIFDRQIQAESGYRVDARSPAGALGIAQFMPATARGMGVNPLDPKSALEGAARYDRQLLDSFGGDYSLALAGYNAGGGNARKALKSFPETKAYVSRILGGSTFTSTTGKAATPSKNAPERAGVAAIAARHHLTHTSGDRPANSTIGAGSGSDHSAARTNRWADDYSGSSADMAAFAREVRSTFPGLTVLDEGHQPSTGPNVHVAGDSKPLGTSSSATPTASGGTFDSVTDNAGKAFDGAKDLSVGAALGLRHAAVGAADAVTGAVTGAANAAVSNMLGVALTVALVLGGLVLIVLGVNDLSGGAVTRTAQTATLAAAL